MEVRPFSKGVKCILDDESGRVTLLLWQEVYDLVPDGELLAVGAMVRVTGAVGDFQGERQIVPDVGGDIRPK